MYVRMYMYLHTGEKASIVLQREGITKQSLKVFLQRSHNMHHLHWLVAKVKYIHVSMHTYVQHI